MTDTPRTCERCGATTPHEAMAKLAAVNIEQTQDIKELQDDLRFVSDINEKQDAIIQRLRAALAVFASNTSWDHYERFCWEWDNDIHDNPQQFAADALKQKE